MHPMMALAPSPPVLSQPHPLPCGVTAINDQLRTCHEFGFI
jgi:hypothetical protein